MRAFHCSETTSPDLGTEKGAGPDLHLPAISRLHRRFEAISEGRADDAAAGRPPEAGASPSLEDIRDRFRASYVLVLNDHPGLYRQLMRRGDLFTLIYPAWRGTGLADRKQPAVALFGVTGQD